MLKINFEKRNGIAIIPAISYYKCPYIMQRNTYGHCLVFSFLNKALWVWFAHTPKKRNNKNDE